MQWTDAKDYNRPPTLLSEKAINLKQCKEIIKVESANNQQTHHSCNH